MKQFKVCFFVLALLAGGPVYALPADHPANPEAAAPAFQPADYFAGRSGRVQLAADEHQHAAAPAAQEAGAQDEAAAREHKAGECQRGEGMGCCCKCCCMGGDGEGGMMCMKKSGAADKKASDMKDCDMMQMMKKKGMQQDGGKAAEEPETKPETNKDEGHEAHH